MKTENFQDNINCIRETSPGRFRIILDFATTAILKFLVWVHNHLTGKGFDFEEFKLPITRVSKNQKTLAKWVRFDYILETSEFKKMIPELNRGIELIQMNKIPPNYLHLDKIKGNTRYELLEKECDYLFEVDIPSATDYGTLISPNRDFLQSVLDNPEINWEDLP